MNKYEVFFIDSESEAVEADGVRVEDGVLQFVDYDADSHIGAYKLSRAYAPGQWSSFKKL